MVGKAEAEGVARVPWAMTELAEFLDITAGQHILAENYNKDKRGVPYITGPSDFVDQRLTITKYTQFPKAVAPPYSVLLTVKGSGCGDVFRNNETEVAISRQLIAVTSTTIDDTFLYYLLIYRNGELKRKSLGNLIPGLSQNDVKELVAPLPPLPEQRAIAGALGEADALLAALDGLIAKKAAVKQAMMKASFENYESWSEIKLRDITTAITKGSTPTTYGFEYQSSGIAFIKAESIGSNFNILENHVAYIADEAYEAFSRSKLKMDDILISIAGVLGRVGIVPPEILPANTNQALAIVRLADLANVCRSYLAYYLVCDLVVQQIHELSSQGAQSNLTLENIGDLNIRLPAYSKQTEIATHLTTLDNELTALRARREKLAAVKAGIMEQLLTGAVRLV